MNNKVLVLVIVMVTLGIGNCRAQLSPYDENAPVGWASIGLGDGCTGSNNQNPVVVNTLEELMSALQQCKGGKASKTIYINGKIAVPEKLRYDKCTNVTIYGLPGSELYKNNRADHDGASPAGSADACGFFSMNGWNNCILRNLTLKGSGAYDISGMDCIQLANECKNIWVDHCDIQDGEDGNLDAKDKSDFITVSWCKFSYLIAPWPNSESADHRCSSMWGASNNRGDDEGHLNATFVNNWWYHGCGQRCPRIRFGNVHIANCLWENGTQDDPAQYCVGIGRGSDLYIENGDFSRTVLKTGQSDMRGHNKYYLTEKKDYELTITGCIGEADAQEMGAGCSTGAYYNPYADPDYKVRTYSAAQVYDVLTDPETGAGATLDEDLLATRGNDNYGVTAIKGVQAADDAQVVGIRYYNLNGAQLEAPQKGVNILEFQMSDGTTRTNKIYK